MCAPAPLPILVGMSLLVFDLTLPPSIYVMQFAITQAEAAAEEARHRAEIEGLMSEQAWWQKALEELGDSKPAIDKAHEAWDEAIAMKEAEAAA